MTTATTPTITLTTDQENALSNIWKFLDDPYEKFFVLSGFSGCGKTTLVQELLSRLPDYQATCALIDPQYEPLDVVLTATTNKAAENFELITGHECGTIHSLLKLRVSTDYMTGKTSLSLGRSAEKQYNKLIFVDEASFIDNALMGFITRQTIDCKIIYVGDPAQLAPVNSAGTPVFTKGYKGAQLREVVRQAKDNPIIDLSTKFRTTVETGEWFDFKPDGKHITHLNHSDFEDACAAEFTRPGWKYHDSKILAWTNKTVIYHNSNLTEQSKGSPDFEIGDYAICNSFVTRNGNSLKTDQTVLISGIEEDEQYGVPGKTYLLDGFQRFFMPSSLEMKRHALADARDNENYTKAQAISDSWIDLRGAYAQTVNKAQGSTYGKVYVVLSDIARCNSGEQIARMLYVAVSRARDQVFLTGDIA